MNSLNEFNIRVCLDGTAWCALIGSNLQEGISGWGDSPSEALMCLSFKLYKMEKK